MKKLLIALSLILPSSAMASFFPGISFNGSGQPVTSTSTVVQLSTVGVVNGGSNLTVQPGNTQNTTPWVITHGAIGQQVTSTQTVVNQSTMGVVNGGSALNVSVNTALPSGTNAIGTVTGSTTGVVNGGATFNVTVNAALPSGTNAIGTVTGSTVGIVNGGKAIAIGGLVSSMTITTGLTDGATTQGYFSSIGQALTTGVPYQVTSSTFSVNVSSQNTNEFIIISSATAPNYNYLCGCVFNNSSATNSFVTLYQSSSTVIGVDAIQIGTPANDVPTGIWPGCTNPFFRSKAAGQITLKASAAVSSTSMRCQYYSAP